MLQQRRLRPAAATVERERERQLKEQLSALYHLSLTRSLAHSLTPLDFRLIFSENDDEAATPHKGGEEGGRELDGIRQQSMSETARAEMYSYVACMLMRVDLASLTPIPVHNFFII